MGLSTTGILSLNQDLVDYLGLEPSFLISIVCGFLGFLEDGEVRTFWTRMTDTDAENESRRMMQRGVE